MLPLRRLSSVVLALLMFSACTDDDGPSDHVYSQTTSLVQYASCSQLETDLEDMLITVHRTADLGQVTAQALPGYLPNDYYWWW